MPQLMEIRTSKEDALQADEQTSSGAPIITSPNIAPVKADQHSWIELLSLGYQLFCQNALTARPTEFRGSNIVSPSTDSLNRFIAFQMREIPTLERIYSKNTGRVFYTWIVIAERDQDVLKRIYAKEREIISRFPDCRFDFYVVYRSGAATDSLISGAEQVFPDPAKE